MARRQRDVLVVGAGPVGMAAALFLAERGIDVEIVEQRWTPEDESFSFLLHPNTLQLLDDIGLGADIVNDGCRIEQLALYVDSERQNVINLVEPSQPYGFAAMVPRGSLHYHTEQRLRAHKRKVEWHHRLSALEVTPEHVAVDLDVLDRLSVGYGVAHEEASIERTLHRQFGFVVATDGRNSLVRRRLGIDWHSTGPDTLFVVFGAASEADLGCEMRFTVTEDGVSTLAPQPGGGIHAAFSLSIREGDLAERERRGERRPTRDDLVALMHRHAPWFESEIGDIAWSGMYRLEPGFADRFGVGRAWLAGEAAHALDPSSSQSLNQGIRSAHGLAAAIERVLRSGEPMSILDEYGRNRQAAAQRLASMAAPISAEGVERLVAELGLSR